MEEIMNDLAKKLLTYATILAAYVGCQSQMFDKEGAKIALTNSGFKPVELGGYAWFAGDRTDIFATKFKAVTARGDTVTGVFTKSLFGGSALHFNK